MKLIEGLHHVSCMTKDIEKNVWFYTEVLGLKILKKSVNQDDVFAYHLFYGDANASVGSCITFFDYPHMSATQVGSNCVYRLGLRVASKEALVFWRERLRTFNFKSDSIVNKLGCLGFNFVDPDGLKLRLMSTEGLELLPNYPNSHPDIPLDFAILGLGEVHLHVQNTLKADQWLTSILNFKRIMSDNDSTLYISSSHRADTRCIVTMDSSKAEIQGHGSIHHIAWRVEDDDHLMAMNTKINDLGLSNSSIVDRHYFKSLYVRDFNRILFEFATDGPGYTCDEPLETLGRQLSLPPLLEPYRKTIEKHIKPLNTNNESI
ncbi:MAG: VOC family protein [Erysipelothrix sp.]|jgi:glyoxalase family protein|nr:VOC family protein [Erysipelothrix sp.]